MWIFLVSVFLYTNNSLAHSPKESDIWISVGPQVTSLLGTSTQPFGGLGITLEGDLDEDGGFELGLYYLKKRYGIELDSYSAVEEVRRMQATMGYKHWLRNEWGVGISFATGYSMGNLRRLKEEGARPTGYKSFSERPAEYSVRLSIDHDVIQFAKSAVTISAFVDHSLHDKSHVDASLLGLFMSYKTLLKEK